MSVSLALLPVALAMRLFMGKERFDAWVESMQVKIPTYFEDDADLRHTVRAAGYDVNEWADSYKTHIRGEDFFFFWEIVDGRWTAVFGKSDSKEEIRRFIADLEAKAGRKLFEWSDGEPVVIPNQTFPTNFRDWDLLCKTLIDYGLEPLDEDGALVCEIEDMTLRFSQEGSQTFTLEVINPRDLKYLHQSVAEIDEVYGENVQQATLARVKEKAAEKGLELVNEEVDAEDGAIVLTLGIKG